MKSKSKKLYAYDDLPLKVYCEIVSTKNLTLLGIGGPVVVDARVSKRWEDIVKESERVTNSTAYLSYMFDIQSIKTLVAEYVLAKSILLRLQYRGDMKLVRELHEMGYELDLTDTKSFAKSLYVQLGVVGNLATQLKIKQNEIELGQKPEPISFDSMVANLSASLGFVVPDSITLARYNEYLKLLRKKAQPKESV